MNSSQLAPVEHSTDAVDSMPMMPSGNGIQLDSESSPITVDRQGTERKSEHHHDEPDDDRHHRDHQQADTEKGADPDGREAFRPIGLFVRKS